MLNSTGTEIDGRIAKWQFDQSTDDDWGLNETRGFACEYVAWQFLCHVTQRETLDFLLEDLPDPRRAAATVAQAESGFGSFFSDSITHAIDETTPLLMQSSSSLYRLLGGNKVNLFLGNRKFRNSDFEANATDNLPLFYGLNALEIAVIAQAKKFLSQKVVQRVIDDIWNGEIVFWDSLSVHSKKKPQFFNKR